MLYSNDHLVEKLKEKLWFARNTIIDMLKEPFGDMFRSYYSCRDRKEARQWERDVITNVIETATKIEKTSQYCQDTAYCPLCGGGTSSYGGGGFTYPEGLRRHLEGHGGKTHQCSVAKEIFALAMDHWNEKFKEQELKEQVDKAKNLEKRKKEEILYRIRPFDEPEVIDAGYSWKDPRDSDAMTWAEDRLKNLGFTLELTDRIKSYFKDYKNVIVFADPRSNKRIDFFVYKKPLPKSKSRLNKFSLGNFYFLDTWKKDLSEKFEARIKDFESKIE